AGFDLAGADVTTMPIAAPGATARAVIVAKAPGVLAGGPLADAVFRCLSADVAVDWARGEGAGVSPGDTIAHLDGPARALLAGERVALNFLQHLSGVATLTAAFAARCAPYGVTLLCTRKTVPGLRAVQRYAVAAGGGSLHRAGLFDAVLIKTNHAILAGGLAEAIRRSVAAAPGRPVEAEVRTVEEAEEAAAAGAGRILVDNAGHATIAEIVRRLTGRVFIEVSGGVTLDNVESIAALGPDAISVGRLTHSAPALDLAMRLV
ncbi:MAG TPA: carboxylating nicotinate-nucleotide diphosphorylase, partial [Actinomycetota bacterium]